VRDFWRRSSLAKRRADREDASASHPVGVSGVMVVRC